MLKRTVNQMDSFGLCFLAVLLSAPINALISWIVSIRLGVWLSQEYAFGVAFFGIAAFVFWQVHKRISGRQHDEVNMSAAAVVEMKGASVHETSGIHLTTPQSIVFGTLLIVGLVSTIIFGGLSGGQGAWFMIAGLAAALGWVLRPHIR